MVMIWKRAQSGHIKYAVVVKVLHQGQELEVWNMPTSQDKGVPSRAQAPTP